MAFINSKRVSNALKLQNDFFFKRKWQKNHIRIAILVINDIRWKFGKISQYFINT